MPLPQRIQRKRTAGYKLPEGAVYVGRPTKWGNPFLLSDELPPPAIPATPADRTLARRQVVVNYRAWLLNVAHELRAQLPELHGKELACWCPPGEACHADVLLELANASHA